MKRTVRMQGGAVVRVPSETTLRKYGLTAEEWVAILKRQGGVCSVCGKIPASGRMVTDHEHVRGYRKLPPEERKKRVRGVLCWTDNLYAAGKGMNQDRAFHLWTYFVMYNGRRGNPS